MGYNLRINGMFWGYNPLTNLLLTLWDIQIPLPQTNSLHLRIDDWNTGFISYVMFGRLLNVVFEDGTFDFRFVLAYSEPIC